MLRVEPFGEPSNNFSTVSKVYTSTMLTQAADLHTIDLDSAGHHCGWASSALPFRHIHHNSASAARPRLRPLPQLSTPPPQLSCRLPPPSPGSTSPPLQSRSRCLQCSRHWPPRRQPPLTHPPRSLHWLLSAASSPPSPPSLPQQQRLVNSLNCCIP